MGRYLVEGGRHAEATESLLEAVLLDGEYAEAHRLLAECYSRIAAELEGPVAEFIEKGGTVLAFSNVVFHTSATAV